MNRKIEYASFEVTSYCNLNCSFCNRDEVIKNPKHISLDSWKIIRIFFDKKNFFFNLFKKFF